MDRTRRLFRPPESDRDLRILAEKTLKGAGIQRDPVIPPLEAIANYAKVKEAPDLLTGQGEEAFIEKWGRSIPKGLAKIKGMIDLKGKAYCVDRKLHPKIKTFTKLHELSHELIPWQKAAAYFDDDYTLAANVRRGYEAEANAMASHLMFRGKLFNRVAEGYSLSLHSAKFLADQWGASYHATFRRYVEYNRKSCAMYVIPRDYLKELHTRPITNLAPVRSYYIVASKRFLNKHGCPKPEETMAPIIASPDFPMLIQVRTLHEGGGLHMSHGSGKTRLRYQVFSNNYHVFLLVMPDKRSRLKKKVEFIRA
jgi:Zn-dependent peptidase ImmA (M78 family)